jgi:1,5-anhydro-D-fructose reductase (1,5-anhydro-D-mannitol-forming)
MPILSAEPVGEVILRRFDQDEVVNVPRLWPLYENVIRHFDAAVRGEGEPLTSGDDGLASLAVALAVRESASHRCPVTPRFPVRAGTW